LCRMHEIVSAGSSAQSRSHASHGSGMQLNTETWIAGDFLARPLRLRAAAGGGIAIAMWSALIESSQRLGFMESGRSVPIFSGPS
jgi:hypothetical protein